MKPQDRELLGALVGGAALYRFGDYFRLTLRSGRSRGVTREAGRLLTGGYIESGDPAERYVPTQKGREAAV